VQRRKKNGNKENYCTALLCRKLIRKKIKAKQTNGANGWIDVEKEQASKMSQFEQDSNNLW